MRHHHKLHNALAKPLKNLIPERLKLAGINALSKLQILFPEFIDIFYKNFKFTSFAVNCCPNFNALWEISR